MLKIIYRSLALTLLISLFFLLPLSAESKDKNTDSLIFGELNQKGIGTFSGKLQMLIMRRNYDHHDASSGTLATTLKYRSPTEYPVDFGLMYIHAAKLFSGGSLDMVNDGAHQVLNDRFSILQEAFLKFDLDRMGLRNSNITIGRRVCDYDFAPRLAIRQKPQAFQGVFMHLGEWKNVSIDAGHIDRFSSWGTRHTGSDYLRYEFKPIEDVVAAQDPGVSQTPSDTSGMQFVNIDANLTPGIKLTAYDLYGKNLYNMLGFKFNTTLYEEDNQSMVWKNHYVMQTDVGDYDDYLESSLDARALQSSLAFRQGDFTIEPGIFTVMSDDDLRHPMEFSFIGTYTLEWFTRAYSGNSDSVFLKSTYTFGKTLLYALWYGTDHDHNVGNGAFDQEIDFVVKHNFTSNLSACVKLGYGHRNNHGASNGNMEDMRLFLTYKF